MAGASVGKGGYLGGSTLVGWGAMRGEGKAATGPRRAAPGLPLRDAKLREAAEKARKARAHIDRLIKSVKAEEARARRAASIAAERAARDLSERTIEGRSEVGLKTSSSEKRSVARTLATGPQLADALRAALELAARLE